jgi:hypothetical protein
MIRIAALCYEQCCIIGSSLTPVNWGTLALTDSLTAKYLLKSLSYRSHRARPIVVELVDTYDT